jgi:energy-coupling factor transporter ATP-binding protein EcfA2
MRSDLMNLPATRLTSIVYNALRLRGWTSFVSVGSGERAVMLAKGEDGTARLGVILGSGGGSPDAVHRGTEFLLSTHDSRRVTHLELFCLTRRPNKPENYFSDLLRDLPLTIHRREAVERLFTEGELGAQLVAWRADKPLIWSTLPLAERLQRFLEAELLADQFTKLSASSADNTRRTPLSKVFADLQFKLNFPLDGDEHDGGLRSGHPRFIQSVHDAMAHPVILRAHEERAGQRIDRVVLMGGPGQGKTTLGVYLCQTLRAALLVGQSGLSDDVKGILDTFRSSGAPVPIGRRFPIRVELYKFAERLATEPKGYDLWAWLKDTSAFRPEGLGAVVQETWRAWLTAWPSCLVFDGLDEVPASANREDLLSAILEFVNELEAAHADTFVVLTTRPQGYRDELKSLGWQHHTLLPLREEDAVEYAGKLFGEWHIGDSLRREEHLKRFRKTIQERSTSALAKSPLQVTILCVLVEQLGHAPKDRWRLFREYYRIIYERERERGLESVAILRDQQELVDRLHAEIGYRLHLADERGTVGGGVMNPTAMRALVVELLTDEGHTGDALMTLAERIINAAFERLVFLVGHSQDRVGFEIRALQEFFAAERLMRGEERLLSERLRAVAASAHWQNVVLFAAGRIIAERDVLIPVLSDLCEYVDILETGLGREAGIGRRLAVRLLAETGAVHRPKVMSPLRRLILSRLQGCSYDEIFEVSAVLAQIVDVESVEVLKGRVLGEQNDNTAWWILLLLAILAPAGIGDVYLFNTIEELVRNHPDKTPVEILYAISITVSTIPERLTRVLVNVNPSILLMARYPRLHQIERADHTREKFYDVLHGARARRGNNSAHSTRPDVVWFPIANTQHVSCHISTYREKHEAMISCYKLMLEEFEFHACRMLVDYLEQPGAIGLATILLRCRTLSPAARHWLAERAPWPLEQCLKVPADSEELILSRAQARELGDLKDWQAAETRWIKEGLSIADLIQPIPVSVPISATLNARGVPSYLWITEVPIKIFRQLPRGLRIENLSALSSRLGAREHYYSIGYSFGARFEDLPEYRELQSLAPDDPAWDFYLDSGIGGSFALTALFASTQSNAWPAWVSRLHRICIRVLSGEFERWEPYERILYKGTSTLLTVHPDQPALIALLDFTLGEFEPSLLKQIQASIQHTSDPRLLVRAHILHATTVTVEDAPGLAQSIAALNEHVQNPLSRVTTLLEQHRPPGALLLLTELLRLLPGPHRGHEVLLYGLLTALPSGVQSLEIAERLGLPTDGLRPAAAALTEPNHPTAQPLWLKHVMLKNFRAWSSGEFTFSKPAEEQGQWVFLVGDNGTGKTTVLRAIALSLMQDSVANRVLAQTYGNLVRSGAGNGEASVTLHDNTRWEVLLGTDKQVKPKSGVQDFVVGYGPRRGTILGVTDREVNFTPGEELETLFVEGGNLIHAASWLRNLHHRAVDPAYTAVDKQLLPVVLDVLKQVLPGVDSIEVSPDEIRVRGERVGDTTIEAMSDGYLTTAGWVVDLMARWLERERAAGRTVHPKFNEIMTGLVLLDEVDLHLHPRWQWSLIEQVRALFPKLSFIVSTHNPLTLLGSKEGEVFVIDRDPDGQLRATARPLPDGATVERLLTGDWFGLPSTLDRETIELLDQHRAALRHDSEGAEAKRLEAELKGRLRTFPDLPLERQVQGIVAEILDAKSQNVSLEERRRARRTALERLIGGKGEAQ